MLLQDLNNNYPEWCGEMKAWLMKLGLWRLVSGKEIQPKGVEKTGSQWELPSPERLCKALG
ncbi:hypothetical protein AMATHDRAFT_162211 [Amanita thiersii Skay4041]|uniref:DUF4219 domain-containing protein n=1 Tax=Amanita thiersii Skay4041 TaxID=703135 RepID=A0A2A9NAB3_9AGAR|nr:hypothetical protein AMATHDRAFT_162211 [Amanita thiersii Skay4041]